MKVLLIRSNASIPEAWLAKLKAWGIEVAITDHTFTQGKKEDEAAYITRIAAWVRLGYGDTVDFFQVFFDRKGWPLNSGIHGKQYHAFFDEYQLAIANARGKNVAATAEHEFMHSLDNFCFAYTGVSLAAVMGVRDWDDEIVHRRDPKTRKYVNRFDDVYPVVRPFVEAAIAERRRLQQVKGLKAMLERLMAELRKAQLSGKAPEELPAASETPVERPQAVPTPKPDPQGQRLYDAAFAVIGKDMSDRAENRLGCADAVNNIHQTAFGVEIGGGTSTYLLYDALRLSSRYALVAGKPRRGDIIISPSGYSSKGTKHGHVGIVGKNTAPDGSLYVMSNDSEKGTWEANYTVKSWTAYFGTKLGFPVHIYRLT